MVLTTKNIYKMTILSNLYVKICLGIYLTGTAVKVQVIMVFFILCDDFFLGGLL